MNDQYRRVSVVDPINPAIDRAKQILFNPFDLGKWFTIGFCAWLAFLGSKRGGGGGGVNFRSGPGAGEFEPEMQQFKHIVIENLYWILPLAIFITVLVVIMSLIVLWLSSRGRFMFLHCVALDVAEVAVPWDKYAAHGNSLFLFRLVLHLLSLAVFLVLASIVGCGAWLTHESGNMAAMAGVIVIGVALFIPTALIFSVIGKLTKDFVVPIMYVHTNRCTTAWRIFMTVLTPYFWTFVLYLLFQIVISMAVAMILFMVCCATCCAAWCLMMIPFIGTVALLPILVFEQSYKLYFLQQFGDDFDVFPPVQIPVEPMPQGLVVPEDVDQGIPGL